MQKIFPPFVGQCVKEWGFFNFFFLWTIFHQLFYFFVLSLFVPLSFSRRQEQCGECRQHGQQSQCWQWTEHRGKLSTQWPPSVTFCCPGHHQGGIQCLTHPVFPLSQGLATLALKIYFPVEFISKPDKTHQPVL